VGILLLSLAGRGDAAVATNKGRLQGQHAGSSDGLFLAIDLTAGLDPGQPERAVKPVCRQQSQRGSSRSVMGGA
jgi:hypothetical protein